MTRLYKTDFSYADYKLQVIQVFAWFTFLVGSTKSTKVILLNAEYYSVDYLQLHTLQPQYILKITTKFYNLYKIRISV